MPRHMSKDEIVESIIECKIRNAEQAVMRMIFDEIEKIIDKHYNKEVFGSNDYDDLEKEAIINFSDAISLEIDELRERRLSEEITEELGEWIMSPDGVKPMTCSKCGLPALLNAGHNEFNDYEIRRYASEHCPHCGKRMKNAEDTKK